jgi:Ca2+-binding RTX toxin-like protein
MHRILLSAAVVIAAAVAVPSVAHGATLHQDGHHRVLLQDEPGETNLVSVTGSRSVVIHDTNMPITLDRVRNCMPVDAYTVRCTALRHFELDLGVGPDVALIDTPLRMTIDGGRGDDRYVAKSTDAPSRVNFGGGDGVDVANYFFATAGVRVSVDLEAGDGRPGDDDRIRRDVESIIGSEFADVLVGSPRTTALRGSDGDDDITGGSGPELLSGDRGNDRIEARDGTPDTVDCGGFLLDRAAVDVADTVIGCAEVTS